MSTTPTSRMIRGFFEHLERALRENGTPLTDDQRHFLFDAMDHWEASIR